MIKNNLLDALKAFTEKETDSLILPVQRQKEDRELPKPRPPEVHKMGLPDFKAEKKKAPYIIHQIITARDVQPAGQPTSSQAVVRSVFSVYHEDGSEGPLALLECMERLRVAMLRQIVVGQFTLDKEAGIEYLIYPDNIPPFYAGEMVSTWILPPVEREVKIWM